VKHCLECGRLSEGTRCPAHARARHTRMYGGRWQRISRHMRASVQRCERCGSPDDLTTDHIEPGSLAAGVQVLCRSCNAKKSGILGG
jgi:hypothetical protein